MTKTADDIKIYIEKVTKDDFRNGLFMHGQSQLLIGRTKIISNEYMDRNLQLEDNLILHAYTLLDFGIYLRDLGGNPDDARRAFEKAASTLEAVITLQPSDYPDRKFYLLMATLSYHLAQLSSCAYSLLSNVEHSIAFSVVEEALIKLMLRDIAGLRNTVLKYRLSENGSDTEISKLLNKNLSNNTEVEKEGRVDEDTLVKCIILSINDNFCSAMSNLVMGIENRNSESIDNALNTIRDGISVCTDWNLVHQWWMHRIAINLILDIQKCTLNAVLLNMKNANSKGRLIQFLENFNSVLLQRKRSEIDLWPSQIEATQRAIHKDENLVVFSPTSSGKTRIAELCVAKCVSEGMRALFVTPLRALSAQTEETTRKVFSPLGKTVSAFYRGVEFGQFDGSDVNSHDIVVLTPEKLDYAIREDSSRLDDVGLVIFDEGHMIGTGDREVRYEVQMQRLLSRDDAKSRRIVLLSAVEPNGRSIKNFTSWICGGKSGDPIVARWRPTRVRFGELVWRRPFGRLTYYLDKESPRSGRNPCIEEFIRERNASDFSPLRGCRRKSFPSDRHELCLEAAIKIASGGQTALIYCPEKRGVVSYINRITKLYRQGVLKPLIKVGESEIEDAVEIGKEWLGPDSGVIKCLKLGIGIHHGSLPTMFRRELEKLMHSNALSIIICSSTLAQGLNLSVNTIIIHSLTRDRKIISSAEFRNIVGRAGRAYVDTEGYILYPEFEEDKVKKNNWLNLISDHEDHMLLSGIAQLLISFASDTKKLFEFSSISEVCNYMLSNLDIWDSINNKIDEGDEGNSQYDALRQDLAKIDLAVLGLIGDSDISEDKIHEKMTKILEGSLLAKSFPSIWDQSESEEVIITDDDERNESVSRSQFENILVSRGRYIWQNSTRAQRRGYFLSGMDFESCREVNSIYQEVKSLLIAANQSLEDENVSSAVDHILDFSSAMFGILPFKPKNLPSDWKKILKHWIKGKSLCDLRVDKKTDIYDFIENGVRYNLNWALNVIVDRISVDSDYRKDDGVSMGKDQFRNLMMIVYSGTPTTSASVLIRAGFGSRHAAMIVAKEPDANFDNQTGLREWLALESTVQKGADSSWPTPETNRIWNDFVRMSSSENKDTWIRREWEENVSWEVSPATVGESVQVFNFDDSSLVLSSNGDRIGRLLKPMKVIELGIVNAKVSATYGKIDICYYGPNVQEMPIS